MKNRAQNNSPLHTKQRYDRPPTIYGRLEPLIRSDCGGALSSRNAPTRIKLSVQFDRRLGLLCSQSLFGARDQGLVARNGAHAVEVAIVLHPSDELRGLKIERLFQ